MERYKKTKPEVNAVNIEYVIAIKFWRFYKEKGKNYVEFYTEDRDPNTRTLSAWFKMNRQICKIVKHGAPKRKNQTDLVYWEQIRPYIADIYKRRRTNRLEMMSDFALELTQKDIDDEKANKTNKK